METDISTLRKEYTMASLDEKEIHEDPIEQFKKWFDEAMSSQILEPNAMVLSTANLSGKPSQRIVLLKGFDENGFVFFTNYNSRKGKEINSGSEVSLLFPWIDLQRQVIIEGTATKVSRVASEEYFQSRPRSSQLGAYISNQSERIKSRDELSLKLKEAEEKFEKTEIPIPDNWGGYLITPKSFEFWQGRESRLHDRIFFELNDDNWQISRLSP